METPHHPQGDRRTDLVEDARFRMLHTLGGSPDLSQRKLASETGMSLGAVNALLNRLIEAGLVEIASGEAGSARFRITYVLSDAGRAEAKRLAGRYLARRQAERAALGAEIAALKQDFGSGGAA